MKYTYHVVPFLDEYLAIGVCDSADEDKYNFIHLNTIGKDIFEMYTSGQSEQQMIAALMEEYEASEQEIAHVVKSFTAELSQKI